MHHSAQPELAVSLVFWLSQRWKPQAEWKQCHSRWEDQGLKGSVPPAIPGQLTRLLQGCAETPVSSLPTQQAYSWCPPRLGSSKPGHGHTCWLGHLGSECGSQDPAPCWWVSQGLESQAGQCGRRVPAWGPRWQTPTWPLGGAHGKVTITVISHMAAGPGAALFYRWAGLGSSLPIHLFTMEPRCLVHLGGEFQHPHPHCPTWPLQEEFPGDPVSDTPWTEPW